MGFRSTLISEHYSAELPSWIKEKYNDRILFIEGTLIASKTEFKIYTNDLFEDFQKALIECGFFEEYEYEVSIAILAEDGVISKVEVFKNEIKYFWMEKQDFEVDYVWQQG